MLIQGLVSLLISEVICLVTCAVSNNYSQNVPTIDIPGYTYIIPYGRSLMLECHVTGIKPIKIKWWKRGRHLVDSDIFHTSLVTNSDHRNTLLLWIRSLTEEESGTYTCSASNSYGMATDKIYVYGYKDEDIPSEEEEDIEIGYFMSAENSARATTPTGGAVYVATTFCILCLTTTFTSRILSHLSNVLS